MSTLLTPYVHIAHMPHMHPVDYNVPSYTSYIVSLIPFTPPGRSCDYVTQLERLVTSPTGSLTKDPKRRHLEQNQLFLISTYTYGQH